LFVLLGAGAYASLIPLPVLAGILITVGIGIIDYKGLKHLLWKAIYVQVLRLMYDVL
jgi:SulP family sulfate permease